MDVYKKEVTIRRGDICGATQIRKEVHTKIFHVYIAALKEYLKSITVWKQNSLFHLSLVYLTILPVSQIM